MQITKITFLPDRISQIFFHVRDQHKRFSKNRYLGVYMLNITI